MQKKKIIREKLKELIPGEKYKFFATFSRFGIDKRFRDKETVLLLDVYVEINGEKVYLTDHIWVKKSKRWNRISEKIKEGSKVTFLAEVVEYFKEGKKEYFIDYGLKSVRNVNPIID